MPSFHYVRELSAFIALERTGQFNKAAAQLGVSAPTFSRLIERLERRLGVPLVKRTSRSLEITPIGRILAMELGGLEARIDNAIEKTIRAKEGLVGEVHLGYSSIGMNCTLPSFLESISRLYPDIRLLLRLESSTQQLAALEAGELDLGFSSLTPSSNTLAYAPLTRHRIMAVVSVSDPLSQQDMISVDELRDRQFVLGNVDRWPTFNPIIDNFLSSAGLQDNPVHRAEDFESICALVSVGLGVGFFTEIAPEMTRSAVTCIPVEGFDTEIVENVVWRKNNSNQAAIQLVDYAQQYFANWNSPNTDNGS